MVPKQLGARLPELVDAVMRSYGEDASTHYIDRAYLPRPDITAGLSRQLLEVTYPGYFGRAGLTSHNVTYHVGEVLARLWETLRREITHCLCHDSERCGQAVGDEQEPCAHQAEQIATDLIARIPEIRGLLATDIQAHYDGDPAAVCASEIILAYPGLLAITLHRYAHALHRADVPFLPRMMAEHVHATTGIDIHPGARIGSHFCIDHGTGVVIGETAEIGNNVKIYQGVTLGALSFPKDERGRIIREHKRHPTVGNDVTIYANAIILGGQTVIGDGAVVGGSVFLTRSVAPGHQVSIGDPTLRVRAPRSDDGDGGDDGI